MKFIFRNILQYYLKYITKIVLFFHQPTIIAIAGSTNKTFIKNEIVKILKKDGKDVRVNPKNFNTKIGLPLSVLYLSSGYNSYFRWLPIIKKAFWSIWEKNFPKYLVLEISISEPGDMKYFLSIIKPKIIIISNITQRFLENFPSMDKIALEYEYLIKTTSSQTKKTINYDNYRCRKLANISQNTIYFGMDKGADYQIKNIKKEINGQKFSLITKEEEKEYFAPLYGKHNIYAHVIALIVQKIYD